MRLALIFLAALAGCSGQRNLTCTWDGSRWCCDAAKRGIKIEWIVPEKSDGKDAGTGEAR